MITSTYGIKLPETGDKGAVVFDALNGNSVILRDHTHDGTDSNAIASTDIVKPFVNLSSASWSAVASGFTQSVTCPGAVTLDKVTLRFRVRTGADIHKFINPTIVPVSLTQFNVIVNDSSLDLEILFI
jgi:hypothetical protein